MSVQVLQPAGLVPADDLAAQSLAVTLGQQNGEDMAVTRTAAGDYVVMTYPAWRHMEASGQAAGSTLTGVAWKAA